MTGGKIAQYWFQLDQEMHRRLNSYKVGIEKARKQTTSNDPQSDHYDMYKIYANKQRVYRNVKERSDEI